MTIIKKSNRISGSQDVKFQAFLKSGIITIKGYLGNKTASDSYAFPLTDYPVSPYDRKQFMDKIYRTFEQEPDLVGQASRHTDAMIRAANEVISC